MDTRLKHVHGERLRNLRKEDAPSVARAIVDAESGLAQVSSGKVNDLGYVHIQKAGDYSVLVRVDDWAKIFPFLRSTSGSFTPITMPAEPPAPILSPQPNRVMPPPPPNPWGTLSSFMEGWDYPTLRKVENLLGATSDQGVGPSVFESGESRYYQHWVGLLEQLFPNSFPV